MKLWFVVIALMAGSFNAIEAGTNGALRKGLGAPIWSVALISVVTLMCACVTALIVGERLPTLAAATALPWWAWLGGFLGFGFVTAIVFAAEPLGAAFFIGLTVTASTVGSILLDHYGLIGFEPHPASWARVIGALLMIAGIALVAIY